MIWITWIDTVWKLRSAFSREKSFLWFVISLLGFSVRIDHLGISSIIRSLALGNKSYECLRQLFRSTSIDLGKLALLWIRAVDHTLSNYFCLFNGKKVYLIDGIKAPKEGRRMAGVKWLFQDSQNNSKASYIFGHYCQALHVLVHFGKSYLSIPLIMRIQDGLSNRRGSLVMRILDLVLTLQIKNSYIVGDTYYWAGELSKELRKMGNHLISRVKLTAVAYFPIEKSSGRKGRPKKYGAKKKLKNFFKGKGFVTAVLKLYGKDETVQYKEKILLCKNHQCLVKYVFTRIGGNKCVFASTDTTLNAREIIELYSYRFKIEFSFKEFVHDFGGFCYRFWSKSIERTRRKGEEKRLPSLETSYHLYLQIAIIAHGLVNIVAIKHSDEIWQMHSSWMRTIRPGLIPSAAVARIAFREGLQNLNKLPKSWSTIRKFIQYRRMVDQNELLDIAA